MSQYLLEPPMVDIVIRDLRVVLNGLAVFIAKSDSQEVIMVIRIFSEHSIRRFLLWSSQANAARGYFGTVDQSNVL